MKYVCLHVGLVNTMTFYIKEHWLWNDSDTDANDNFWVGLLNVSVLFELTKCNQNTSHAYFA